MTKEKSVWEEECVREYDVTLQSNHRAQITQ